MILSPVSPILVWFLLGIFFFVIELLAPGLILFFFGVGAWCAALALSILSLSSAQQLFVFIAASLLSLALLRSMLRKLFRGRMLEVDVRDDCVPAGARGVVIEAIIPPQEGKVKYSGSFWKALATEPIEEGESVRVLRQDNLTLTVSRIVAEEER